MNIEAIKQLIHDGERIDVDFKESRHGLNKDIYDIVCDFNNRIGGHINPTISKIFREIGLADELGSGMRNTYKYTRLYSGTDPLFEEGDIFKTIIPLKKIATQKVGGENVPRSVAQDVARNVARDKENIIEFIKLKIKENNKITRQRLADELGISVKTIERIIKRIPELQYVGRGSNGHW